MNITGIIAEYNPFHNGHAYQLAQAREQTNADYLIVIMSGNFVQRGAPALLDKFTRAKMALFAGADVVIELPALWSCASAQYFASAGIALLHQLGCVSSLCCGCETLSNHTFLKISSILTKETSAYQMLLSDHLKAGASFARAREQALLALLPEHEKEAASSLLQHPNNILALEYERAMKQESSSLRLYPILRQGPGYHSLLFSDCFASASAIRNFLAAHPASHAPKLQRSMPAHSYETLIAYERQYPFLYADDCSQMMHYCLLKNAAGGFSHYADCTKELSNRIVRQLPYFTGFSDFCTQLKTKNITYTRISRVLMHILLDMHQSSYLYWRSHSYVPYARILGFRKKSRAVLTYLKKHCAIPLLTRAADAKKILSAKAELDFYQKDLFANAVYRALIADKSGNVIEPEGKQQIIIV